MKFLVFSILMLSFLGNSTQAADSLPIPRLHGRYFYQNSFQVTEMIRTELVPSQTPEGQKRLKDLRADGYNCINKDLQMKRCRKTWTPEQPPAGMSEAVAKFMAQIEVEFLPNSSTPELIHDGVSQEWYVRDQVRLMTKMIDVYRVTLTKAKEVYLSFPIGEDQPIGNLVFKSTAQLGFKLSANQKESDLANVSYVLVAYLEPDL